MYSFDAARQTKIDLIHHVHVLIINFCFLKSDLENTRRWQEELRIPLFLKEKMNSLKPHSVVV